MFLSKYERCNTQIVQKTNSEKLRIMQLNRRNFLLITRLRSSCRNWFAVLSTSIETICPEYSTFFSRNLYLVNWIELMRVLFREGYFCSINSAILSLFNKENKGARNTLKKTNDSITMLPIVKITRPGGNRKKP